MGAKLWFIKGWSGSLALVDKSKDWKLGNMRFGCGEGRRVGWWKEVEVDTGDNNVREFYIFLTEK
jgi:hypothetical protein